MSPCLQTTTPSANPTWAHSKNLYHPHNHLSAKCRLSRAGGLLYSPIRTRYTISKGLITHGKATTISSLELVMKPKIGLLNWIAKLRTYAHKQILSATTQTRLHREPVSYSKRLNPRAGLAAHSSPVMIISGTARQGRSILHSRRLLWWSLVQLDKSSWRKIIKFPPDKILNMLRPTLMISRKASPS